MTADSDIEIDLNQQSSHLDLPFLNDEKPSMNFIIEETRNNSILL
jgi:hypothetical protein